MINEPKRLAAVIITVLDLPEQIIELSMSHLTRIATLSMGRCVYLVDQLINHGEVVITEDRLVLQEGGKLTKLSKQLDASTNLVV